MNITLDKHVEDFVVGSATSLANLHLEEIEDNFTEFEEFKKAPESVEELQNAYDELMSHADEYWWRAWEWVSDELPDMLSEEQDCDEVRDAAKELLAKTYDKVVLAGLKKHYGL